MSEKFVDLHTHSTASDGAYQPAELVDLARQQQLAALALTDHDTVAGIDEFLAAAAGTELAAVPGVEISTAFENRELHIVGLFIDHQSEYLRRFLEDVRAKRHERNLKIVNKLQARGYDITMEEVTANAGGDVVGRPHFAQVLLEKYEFESFQDVFEKLLKRGRPGYVPRGLTRPSEAIEAIHQANGIAIWAHPIFRQETEYPWCRKTVKFLKNHGLDALEVYYSAFNATQTSMLKQCAAELGLGMSGGSDFHGTGNSEIKVGFGTGGLRVPEEIYLSLKQLAEQRRA